MLLHTEPDGDDTGAKLICDGCVTEPYLSEVIQRTGKRETCGYCDQTGSVWMIRDLADAVERAFDEHYVKTAPGPDSWQQMLEKESDYEWDRQGYPVVDAIEDAAGVPREAAEDVQAILDDRYHGYDKDDLGEENEFDSDSYYDERSADSSAWQREWNLFVTSLKSEARFFSKAAAAHLESVFGDVDKIKTWSRRGIVLRAGPSGSIRKLFRARVFQSDESLEEALCRPDSRLGSPPSKLASAGRMNARGISVFYGATAASAAIAEVRPPVGSKVAVGRFAILRPLRLLDLSALEKATAQGSVFDPNYKDRLERTAFLRRLGQLMTRPVMPDDEALDYLATQAVADFLATENTPSFDGIVYPSVQVKGGRNVVLFHKAARVEELELPKGCAIEARSYSDTEDGPEVDYWVSELVPPEPPTSANPSELSLLDPFLTYDPNPEAWDGREPTLRVDLGSIEVHWINWVSYRSTAHVVSRHRFEVPSGSDEV